MAKHILLVLGALAVILRLANDLGSNRAAIARARNQATHLAGQRDSLAEVVRRREAEQAALGIRIETHQADAQRLRDSVIALERRRAAAQLTVRQIQTVGALQKQLRASFPELGDSAWGITTVPLEPRDTIGIEYLMVPAWFAETFVMDHQNAESWRAQKDQLLAVDSLRLVVIALQGSVTRLVAANAEAYQTGYQAAYAGYQDLSGRYVAQLRKPRITLGRSIEVIAAAGAGFLLAGAIRE